MAIAAAADALIERVEPNWAMERVPSQASRADSDSPGTLLAEQEAHPARHRHRLQVRGAGQVVDAEQPHVDRVQVVRQLGGRLVVPDVLVAVGDHRPAAVPAPVADDVHLCGQERVGGSHDRADVEVVLPVLDRDMEVVPPGVEVRDDRGHGPVAVAVHDVAPVAVGQQRRVVPGVGRRWALPRADPDFRGAVRHRVVRRPLVAALGPNRRWS